MYILVLMVVVIARVLVIMMVMRLLVTELPAELAVSVREVVTDTRVARLHVSCMVLIMTVD